MQTAQGARLDAARTGFAGDRAPLAASRRLQRSAGRVCAVAPTAQAVFLNEKAQPAVGEKVNSKSVAAVILGGGAGTRLFPLTKQRAKPAVPIGGAYRLIDVPMSNCINSGISKVYVLTQFNSTSLNRHMSKTYNFGNGIKFGGDGFVEVLAATQTPGTGGTEWFQGTADAVRQYSWLFMDVKNKDVDDVVILSGDHLYRMDYLDFVQKHRDTGADITVSALPMDNSRASDFGLMKIDATGRITSFGEKPKGDALKAWVVDTTVLGLTREQAQEMPYIASMGIYVFKKKALLELLNKKFPRANDFGSEIIPEAAKEMKVQAYLFNGYWEDIGTIRSFFDANLALAKDPARFEFYDADNPIYTSPRFLPPAKLMGCKVKDTILAHGVFMEGCDVESAIIGLRSRIGAGVTIRDSMIIGADYYESEEQRAHLLKMGKVPVGVGANSTIKNAIIDKNAGIGAGCKITNAAGVDEAARPEEGFYIRSGIVVVLRNSSIAPGTVI